MADIKYRIVLTSDAEPGTGLGGAVLDQLVPRDERGSPQLRATHIKGLVRANLETIAGLLGWPEEWLVHPVLGRGGEQHDAGLESTAYFSDATSGADGTAVPDGDAQALQIYRTAVGEHGGAKTGTLRGSEAIAKGTVFEGSVRRVADGLQADIIKLGLRSLTTVGSNRQRGSGACYVEIESDHRPPSKILEEIRAHIEAYSPASDAAHPALASRPMHGGAAALAAADVKKAPTTWYRLTFQTEDPLCCPETPITGGTNVVRSGIAIPASAVMGAVLTAISRENPELASLLVDDEGTRFWPLLPAPLIDGNPTSPSWSSVSLRTSKLPQAGKYPCADRLIDTPSPDVRWKGCEGVVLSTATGEHWLWRTQDIPRRITAHAVPSRHDLYSVESIVVERWSGLLAIRESAGAALRRALETNSDVVLGKSRGVRGLGTLSLEPVDETAREFGSDDGPRIFVAQSPIVIPREWQGQDTEGLLLDLAHRDWHGYGAREAAGLTACVFGWNRTLDTGRLPGGIGRLRAERVFRPGAAIVVDRPLRGAELQALLLHGLGGGRNRGFGAVLPYPAVPHDRYTPKPRRQEVRSRHAAGIRAGLGLTTLPVRPPSASQVGRLIAYLEHRPTDRISEFLSEQKQRGARGWAPWQAVVGDLERLDSLPVPDRIRSLEVWRDWLTARTTRRARTQTTAGGTPS